MTGHLCRPDAACEGLVAGVRHLPLSISLIFPVNAAELQAVDFGGWLLFHREHSLMLYTFRSHISEKEGTYEVGLSPYAP